MQKAITFASLIIINSVLCFSDFVTPIIITEDWAPYNYIEKDKITGLSTQIVLEILNSIDERIDIELLPSIRAKNILDNSQHIIFYSIFKTKERESQYKWVGPIADGSIYFYKNKTDKRNITTIDELKNLERICCRHAGLIPSLLSNMGFKNLDMTASDSNQIYTKLALRRCDAAISDTDLGVRHYLRTTNLDQDTFEKIPIVIFQSSLYIAFTKDFSDEYIGVWQEALDKMKRDGTYNKILRQYQ
jgi:polar amino acid transport system substrate-binding protein